ncbi:hypothetical protein [Burkholderia gladioli]|uniref:hypothetical protein n=1 Tax=Burkholderia gladioli TaxID=28095 RepID=UPI001640E80A|nr:hypothetical protein [Burkholderia gladioli]
MDKTCIPDLKTFYRSLSAADKKLFATAADTTTDYIETHLVYARKIPRPESMERLVEACEQFGAPFDKAALLLFFYPDHSGRSEMVQTKEVA